MINFLDINNDWVNIKVVDLKKDQKHITICPAIHYAKYQHYSEINKILSERELVVSEGLFYDYQINQSEQQPELNNEQKTSISTSSLSGIGQVILADAFNLKSQNTFKFTYKKIIGDLSFSEFIKQEEKEEKYNENLNDLIDVNFQMTNYISRIFNAIINKDYESLSEFYTDFASKIIKDVTPVLDNINALRERNAIFALTNTEKSQDLIGIHYGVQHVNVFFDHLLDKGYDIDKEYLLPAIPLKVTVEEMNKRT